MKKRLPSFLERIGEFGVIDLFRKFAARDHRVLVGIGDDCAILKSSRHFLAVSCDAMIEGVHFLSDKISPWQLGWKALATALSDLAACGAEPVAALLLLGLRGDETPKWLSDLAHGINICARKYGANFVGGDTVRSPSTRIVSFTVLGRVLRKPVLRSTARSGELIGVCGTLGDSAAGLEILLKGKKGLRAAVANRLIKAHLEPKPQFEQSRILGLLVSAMIDTSDGLVKDLSHICSESGVGARLDAEKIPLSSDLRNFAACCGRNPLDYALAGGEDYRLLFTISEKKASLLLNRLRRAGFEATIIGTTVKGSGVDVFYGGRRLKFERDGFDHFGKRGHP